MRIGLIVGLLCVAPIWAQPTVSAGGVRNAASNAENQGVTGGGLISIYGSGLAAELAQASSVPLSTSIGDVTVMVNNTPAPLLFVSPNQINAQLPFESVANLATADRAANIGNAQLVVRRGNAASAPAQVPIADFAPGIFSVQFGVGQAIAILVDGVLAAPAGSIPGLATRPARVGDAIIIYCTGLGPVNPSIRAGSAPIYESNQELRHTTTRPTVLVGGREAAILFSGLTPQFTGVYQVNAIVPEGVTVGNAVPLQLRMGDITSTNQVTIAIQ
jgi:uncharacterized protein (TIGR03437 family)